MEGTTVQNLNATLRRLVRERIGIFRVVFVFRILQWPLRLLARFVAGRVGRDEQLIAFGADADRFADNAAYLFLHMSEHADAECVWISGSRKLVDELRTHGLRAERRWTPAGVRVALRASWYAYTHYRTDINGWLNTGAQSLNLWHGVGVKLPFKRSRTVGLGAAAYGARDGSILASVFEEDRRPSDWMLTTSPEITEAFSREFEVPAERCLPLGYPRTDHLVSDSAPPAALVDAELYAEIEAARPVVGYFPTFRDSSASLPVGEPVVREMDTILRSQGGRLLFKAHEKTPAADVDGTGALVLPTHADLNAYLGLCDVVVTDYSSVAADFMLMGRPLVRYWPDHDEFDGERGFLFDPEAMLPGTLTRTPDELYAVLGDVRSIAASPHTEAVVERWWGDSARPGASQRLVRFLADGTIQSGVVRAGEIPNGEAPAS